MYLTQIGAHDWHNAGDCMLCAATRELIDKANGPHYWELINVYHHPPRNFIEHLNQEVKALIIGGGGLLNPGTTVSNRISGWLCPLSLGEIKQLKIPIIVFAIGNSRFRGAVDFNHKFKPHIQEVARRSKFLGLRNYGSLTDLIPYLESDSLAEKLSYQPCPTTLLKFLYPEYAGRKPKQKQLALNIALDSCEYRFGNKAEEILTAIARAMKWATDNGWQIKLALHRIADSDCIDWLEQEHVDYELIMLCNTPPRAIMDFYTRMSLTVAMRSHGQMIPFGLGNPSISLISHNKLKYFLDDMGYPEWGIEVGDEDLENKLIKKIEYMDENEALIRAQIAGAQGKLWQITNGNLKRIGRILA